MTKSQNSPVVLVEAPIVVAVVVAACPVVAVVRQWAAVTAADQITVVGPRLGLSTELLVLCVTLSELAMVTAVAVVVAVVVAIRRNFQLFTKTPLKKRAPLFREFCHCQTLTILQYVVDSKSLSRSFSKTFQTLDVATFATQNGRQPPDAGRVEKWRDLQRPPRSMRQLDESSTQSKKIILPENRSFPVQNLTL